MDGGAGSGAGPIERHGRCGVHRKIQSFWPPGMAGRHLQGEKLLQWQRRQADGMHVSWILSQKQNDNEA